MCRVKDSEIDHNSDDKCYESIWDQAADKVKLHQDALAYAIDIEKKNSHLEADLKSFWDKEQPILDQKIQQGRILKIKGLYLGMNIDDAYKVIPDQLKADLTLVNFGKMIADLPFYNGEVAIEIKYEPDHKRKDFRKKKLESPIVSWSDNTNQSSVTGDVKRIKTFVEADRAVTGYAIFIDEGSYFRNKKKMPDGCEWYDKFGRTSGALLIFKNG